MADPTRSLTERTPAELGEFADDHLILALTAADMLHGDRQAAEDFLRDRLVTISDSWDKTELVAEDSRRKRDRLHALIFGKES